jgi:hypothetical protein
MDISGFVGGAIIVAILGIIVGAVMIPVITSMTPNTTTSAFDMVVPYAGVFLILTLLVGTMALFALGPDDSKPYVIVDDRERFRKMKNEQEQKEKEDDLDGIIRRV